MSPGMPTESSCMARHDGLEGLADVGSGGEAGGGLLFEAAEDDGLELDGEVGGDLADGGRVGELDGADGLELGRVGAVEGMAAGGELVEDEAEGEDVGLDGGLAGDELLGRHVGDGAAAGGVGGAGDGVGGGLRLLAGPEGSNSALSGLRRRARPKSRILMRPPSVSMTLAGLRSRWKMPR